MNAPETPAPSTARRQLHRRVKRGIVVSYLHGLSQRHRPAAVRPALGDPAAAAATSGAAPPRP
jgi:hypothetical protein